MFVNSLIQFLIRLYRKLVSPFFAPNCRFYPTCSSYSLECFEKFHFLKALWYSLGRILRCNPLFKGGKDLVPKG